MTRYRNEFPQLSGRRCLAEGGESATLDDGHPVELVCRCREKLLEMPWIDSLSGCGGSDLGHVAAIARAVPA